MARCSIVSCDSNLDYSCFGDFRSSVADIGLRDSTDREIFLAAKRENVIVMTKDRDFVRLLAELGPPPKVIWVRIGNGSTAMVEALLRRRIVEVAAFSSDPESAFLILD